MTLKEINELICKIKNEIVEDVINSVCYEIKKTQECNSIKQDLSKKRRYFKKNIDKFQDLKKDSLALMLSKELYITATKIFGHKFVYKIFLTDNGLSLHKEILPKYPIEDICSIVYVDKRKMNNKE